MRLAVVPHDMTAVAPTGEAMIQIELRRGPLHLNVRWPTAAAEDCRDWLRELSSGVPTSASSLAIPAAKDRHAYIISADAAPAGWIADTQSMHKVFQPESVSPSTFHFDARTVPPAIRNAMRLLELEQVEVPAIESLAARIGLSPAHFSRQFAAAFGQASAAYGRRIRLDHAINRMLFDPAPLHAIAGLFGFRDQTAFNRAFRRQHGASPRQFVEALRQTGGKHPGQSAAGGVPSAPSPDVVVSEHPPALAYARRFFGPDWAQHWAHFEADLPIGLPDNLRRAGLAWDHPGVTPPAWQRYDCALVVPTRATPIRSLADAPGLDAIELPGGWHAALHGLPTIEAVPSAIALLMGGWLRQQSAFAPEGDPLVHRRDVAEGRWTATIRLHRLHRPATEPSWNLMPVDDQRRPLGRR